MPDYVIEYAPNDYQLQVHQSPARFRLVVAHRRFGKTTLAVNEIVRASVMVPGNYFYIAPYRNQAKMIAWDMFKKYFPPGIVQDWNESDLIVKLSNGSVVSLKGADMDPDRLRGAGLHGVVLDEFADMKANVWPEIIRPMLSDTKGWAMFIGTPKPHGQHFRNLFVRGKDENEGIASFMFPSSKTGIIDHDELESARKDMPEEIFRQEYECEFLEGKGSVFRKFDRCIRGNLETPNPGRHYQMGVDLARLEDFTVIMVIDRHTRQVVHFERFNEIDWSFQKAKIEAAARRYNDARVKLDATGIGDPIEEDLRKQGLNVEGIRYTSEQKKKLIENLSIMIEQGEVTFPNIPELIGELETFSYEISPSTKRVRYNAPQGLHDDCVNALALACWEIGTKMPVPDVVHPLGDNPFPQMGNTSYRPLSTKTGY